MQIAHLLFSMIAAASMSAQDTVESSLLPAPVSFSGVVVDDQGRPIPEVRIDPWYKLGEHRTDSEGRFRIEDRTPAVVFRKPGFEPVFARLKNTSDVRITMKVATRTIATCSSSIACALGMHFCYPNVANVETSREWSDVDYSAQSFIITTPRGKKRMDHGQGIAWDRGVPPASVWDGAEFTETDYDDHGRLVMDARGKTSDGKLWRWQGEFAESTQYYNLAPEEAALFDKVLDGFCIRSAKQ
jgi:hypothetical protein